MSQPPDYPPSVGQLSPDGKWQWDGTYWVPVPTPPPPASAPRKKSRRWFWIAALIGVLIVGTCIGIAGTQGSKQQQSQTAAGVAAQAEKHVPSTPTAAPTQASGHDGSCSPQPCANDNYGWIVTVSDVRYGAVSNNEFEQPESGNVFVTLEVTFTNKLDAEQSANPYHFVLLDGAGVKHTWNPMGPCQAWKAVNVTKGASYGPKCLSFEATAGKPTGLVLVWTPSLVGGDYNIKLS